VNTVAPAEITRQPQKVLPQTGTPGGHSSSQETTILGILASLAGIALLLTGLRLARARD